MRLRTDYTDCAPDLKKDFYILRHTSCASILSDNLFIDNPNGHLFLLSEEDLQAIVDLHVEGVHKISERIGDYSSFIPL